MISINRGGLRIGPVFIRLSRRYLANWGFEALRIGGLSIWSRTSSGDRMLASYHPRWTHTWLWSACLTRSTRGYCPIWSTAERDRRARLWGEGNPHVSPPSGWDRVFQRDARRKGQWHDYYRLPFGYSLLIAQQDPCPVKR